MDKRSIVKRVLAKLDKDKEMSSKQAIEIIFKDFVKKEEIFKPNYKKTLMLSNEQHSQLRDIHDQAPVKKLYAYGLGRFGFILEGVRFDVEPASVDIKKEK